MEKTGQFSKQRIFSVVILIAETSNKGQQVATEGYIKYIVYGYLISSEKLRKPGMRKCMYIIQGSLR